MLSHLEMSGVGMTSERTRNRLIERLLGQGIKDVKVLDVIHRIPRHLFVDEAFAHRAYEDTALPIGFGQTISQPYIVAKMTELLASANITLGKVLEVGTGSGYQTSILALLARHVYSVERIAVFKEKALQRTRQLGLNNIFFSMSDGHQGLKTYAPYDAILCSAASKTLPEAMLQQLAPNGVIVIPIGDKKQQLLKIQRNEDSTNFTKTIIETVRFVPLLTGVSTSYER